MESPMLHDMPEELLALILSHCPLSSLPCAAAACRRFAACAAPDQPVWRRHILRRLGAGEETERWPVSGGAGSRAHATPSWRDLLLAHHSEAAALSAVAALDTSDIASFLKFRAAQVANCWREELPPPAQLLKGASVQQLCISGGTVSFTGRLGRDRAVRAESPVPLSSKYVSLRAGGGGEAKIALSDVYYFEVSISDAPLPGDDAFTADRPPCVSIGLATEHFRLQDKQAGWTSDSLGWHGDDGVLYHRSGRGLQRFGPPFGAGDTIGCGVHLTSRRVFFTLNGSL
ncbi:hypothetical protein EMIHUDRAFT_196861, partial [Emiliania huxleyi CCMP1516]|uniref:B30.2/SPRY domain-containing protein n=3 Tax=Emiliania huxleyi TaxID=2903 RepID=A0A0D3ITB1_EMIH1